MQFSILEIRKVQLIQYYTQHKKVYFSNVISFSVAIKFEGRRRQPSVHHKKKELNGTRKRTVECKLPSQLVTAVSIYRRMFSQEPMSPSFPIRQSNHRRL